VVRLVNYVGSYSIWVAIHEDVVLSVYYLYFGGHFDENTWGALDVRDYKEFDGTLWARYGGNEG
jgi:hypothetical protein